MPRSLWPARREAPGAGALTEPFIFGIPLIARAAARDWALVEHLFDLTLRSVLAQADPDFRLFLAAHDVPAAWSSVAHDPRFTLLRADWAPAPPTAANDDGGRKKWLIKQAVREAGGGLLMFLDADDWIATDLVRTARRTMRPDDIGAVVAEGYALDFASLRLSPFPVVDAFDGAFHGLCGSSTIGRIVPTSAEPHRLDPHAVLGSHHEWVDRAAQHALPLAVLPTSGMYLIGTGENHSEAQGPFADWRRSLTRSVRANGTPLSDALARQFGQRLVDLHPVEGSALPPRTAIDGAASEPDQEGRVRVR